MFDDPGKKLYQLQDELFELDPQEDEELQENFAVDFDDNMYDDEEFDEDSAVLAEAPKRNRGAATLLVLIIAAIAAWAAARWMGWI